MSHSHRAVPMYRVHTPFTGPVRSPENRRAHGNICQVDVCRCGAVRRSNRNVGAIEMGRWEWAH